jgi:hypothetical protein
MLAQNDNGAGVVAPFLSDGVPLAFVALGVNGVGRLHVAAAVTAAGAAHWPLEVTDICAKPRTREPLSFTHGPQ